MEQLHLWKLSFNSTKAANVFGQFQVIAVWRDISHETVAQTIQ